ncbi:4-hydroxy-tetrahydrodipicolinate synthase [Candidatus Oleimmundimicrobium sp.]|uniref:4-hydroxy-tetrahydrodipicolinate synthase n=1 Tax=Candidatus Oleimmundimicrobium sp. TaxID=3060597 RepID=UPI0027290C81|nr:4-hydroxy-tetrahydrodipicolinate synthase [Candidatus Oleimmundimicrobium sp.]MDO8885439.1 4-hydroxy-tetrahydrodipicolinate synthase [Candidatus Oleimmundimicrobium sp.]
MFGEVLTAMVTPFKEDLSVDYARAQELASYLINNGSDGVVVSGTTGESPTLSDDEKVNLYKVVKEVVGGKGSVIAGTGYNSTKESIDLTKKAESIGVDGCMLVTPYYNKPPQKGLYNHFKMVAESTSLPVILYNVPGRTARNLEADTVIALSEVPNIVGVKEASGNFEQIAKIKSKTPEDFFLYSGEDSATYPVLALGGCGVISVASHLVGKEIKKMVSCLKNGNYKESLKIHLRLLPLFDVLFLTTNPIMVKAGVKLKGIDVGGLRPPMIDADDEQISKLKKIMEKLEVL